MSRILVASLSVHVTPYENTLELFYALKWFVVFTNGQIGNVYMQLIFC